MKLYDQVENLVHECLSNPEIIIQVGDFNTMISIKYNSKNISFALYDDELDVITPEGRFSIGMTENNILKYKLLYNECIEREEYKGQKYLDDFFRQDKIITADELNDDDE